MIPKALKLNYQLLDRRDRAKPFQLLKNCEDPLAGNEEAACGITERHLKNGFANFCRL